MPGTNMVVLFRSSNLKPYKSIFLSICTAWIVDTNIHDTLSYSLTECISCIMTVKPIHLSGCAMSLIPQIIVFNLPR